MYSVNVLKGFKNGLNQLNLIKEQCIIYNVQCSVVNRKLENLKYLTESREQWNYKAFFFDL